MSASVEGLQELIDKLEGLTDQKFVDKVQKGALKKQADAILNEMKNVTPVSTVRNIHGIDAERILSFRYDGKGGYKIGLTNMGGDWERTRGVWFQNYKTDEPNFGWWTNFYKANRERWLKEAKESIRKALEDHLN